MSEAGAQFKDGVILLDLAEMRITYFNDKAESLIGALATSTFNIYDQLLLRTAPPDRAYIRDQVQSMFVNRRSSEIEFRISDQSSTTREKVICCTNYFLNSSSQLLIILTDLTHAKSHEDFLIEFGTKKNTLLETMTHHFSGALRLMQQLTEQAESTMADKDHEQHIQYLRLLSANTESCISMMDNLLKEEHVKSPEIATKIFRIDIVARISIIYNSLINAYPSRVITFDTVAPSIFIQTDEFKVLQIINNFVSNAIKFTPAEKQIAISIYQTGNNVIISVEDEGVGIPERIQPFLFNKKSEAGRTGLSGELSHGYGLSISKMLAESMGASIEYETEESKGTIFYLLLPFASVHT